jgi:hypothetical protein
MSEKDVDKDKQESQESGFNENQIYANSSASVELESTTNTPPVWIWFSVAGLLLVALLVIFVLPALVTEYELPLERRVDVTELQALPSEVEPVSTISPFEEAQRSRQRKEAQDVLAELLTYQEVLEIIEVESWASEEYAAALEVASIGDEYYRAQDFQLATDSYTQGRDDLVALQDLVPAVLEQTLIDAQNALDAQNSTVAQDKFSLALLFDPDSVIAQIGLERSRALDEVSGLFAEADNLLEDGELEAAQAIYRQIVSLDSYNEAAQQKISEVAGLILQREFSAIMSSGYALLESDNPDQAIAEFERAASLGINQDQAVAAITQTENEIANAEISVIQLRITEAESQEQWHTAVAEYDNVLAVDANLVFAINGRDYASKRAQLDDLFVSAIETPDRFYEQDVFQQTLDIYYTGQAIENPGPRLSDQVQKLQVLLETSQVPLDIQMVSDNLTDVTILRIGNLGLFEQTTVSLKPGRYVAVGKRIGYREVREEFVVGFSQTPDSVLVQCVERVVATNR